MYQFRSSILYKRPRRSIAARNCACFTLYLKSALQLHADEDFDEDLEIDPQTDQPDYTEGMAVTSYLLMCKVKGIRPLKTFQNSLNTDAVSVRHVVMSQDDMSECCTALVVCHKHVIMSVMW